MDIVEELKSSILDSLSSGLDNLERLVTEHRPQKLYERDAASEAENQEHVREIGTLQVKAARAGHLELENTKLRAELEALRARCAQLEAGPREVAKQVRQSDVRAVSTVSIEDHDRIKDELARYEHDYRRIVFAHNFLKLRIQHYKDMAREWRAHDGKCVLECTTRQTKFFPQDMAKPTPGTPLRDERPERLSSASNAPSPPAYPADFTPSVSGDSRSILLNLQDPVAESSSLGQRCETASGCGGGFKATTHQVVAMQAAIDHGHNADLEDLTQSDESEERPGTANLPRTPRSKGIAGGNVANPLPADSASSPIVVTARSLKRKRCINKTKASVRVKEDFQKAPHTSKSRSIKEEVTSSSPLRFAQGLYTGELQDSIDLDDVGDYLTTPRKRQQLEQTRLRSSMLILPLTSEVQEIVIDDRPEAEYEESGSNMVKYEDSRPLVHANGNPCGQPAVSASRNDEELLSKLLKREKRIHVEAHNDRVVERRKTAEQSPSRSTVSTHGDQALAVGGAHQSYTPQGREDTEQMKAESASPQILRPTDPNTRILPRTNAGPAKRQYFTNRRSWIAAAAVPAMAEDGEDLPSLEKHTNPSTAKKASKGQNVHHRLGALLSEPFAAKDLLPALPPSRRPGECKGPAASTTPLARTCNRTGLRPLTTLSTKPAQGQILSGSVPDLNKALYEESESARTATRALAAKSMIPKSSILDEPLDSRPEHEPLRARPIHRLGLEDFKLNPAHSDYAYHESVRKHDEKKAISGCTDKTCPRCQEIRKFVQNSGYANLPGHDSDAIDQRLMEDFVGGDGRRLSKISAEDKKEILINARMQQFADKFGKHRQRFDRAQSPVGFWDLGFPSTQEDEQNRKVVEIRRREKVEERYWEAIRQGGRYVFADE